MVGQASAVWLAAGVALVALHTALAFGASYLIHWIYFDMGWKWTPDPTMPQVQAMMALGGSIFATLLMTPVGLVKRSHNGWALPIAIAWPPLALLLPFALPNIIVWLLGIIMWIGLGLFLFFRADRDDGA